MFGLRFRALENLIDELTPPSHMKRPVVKSNPRNEFPIANPFAKKEKEVIKVSVVVNGEEVSIPAVMARLSNKEDELCEMIDDVINAISHETAKDKKDNLIDFVETLDADISYADMSKAIDEFMTEEQEAETPVEVDITVQVEVTPVVEVTEEVVVVENTFTTTTGDEVEDIIEYVEMPVVEKKKGKKA